MKRWQLATGGIVIFFLLAISAFKSMKPHTDLGGASTKVENFDVAARASDSSKVSMQGHVATQGEKSPVWGTQLAPTPKTESISFADASKKTTKQDKKKKKKTKKKKRTQPTVTVQIIRPRPQPATPTESEPSDFGGPSANAQVDKKKDPNALPETPEEWEERILHPPSQDALLEFIKYHNVGFVTDDIFYGLCVKMITPQQSEQIREFGIIALASSPSSQSFILFSRMMASEKSTQLKRRVGNEFPVYYNVQYIEVLGSVLNSTEVNARYNAVISIAESATRNIHATAIDVTPQGNRNRTKNPRKQSAYEKLLGPLKNLAARDPSPEVRTAAFQTYQQIEVLIANTQPDVLAGRE